MLTLNNIKVKQDTIEVQWVSEDGQYHRKAYVEDQRTEFEEEVEGAAAYITAAGWNS